MIKKLLIANRGEIACRIIKTAKQLGITTVAVYSEIDRHALHVSLADEAYLLGPAPASQSYLKREKIIAIAKEAKVDAIHPGYGFLAEDDAFALLCEQQHIIFVGPSAKAIAAMGDKRHAKTLMAKANVPIVPGYAGAQQDLPTLTREATRIGFPLLIKAAAGGGGKGMRLITQIDQLAEAVQSAQREAKSSFGDEAIFLEKYVQPARHIEVQIFMDQQGHGVYLFDRDCSLQRRHQKIIEEADAPHLAEKIKQAMGEAAVLAAKAIQYVGAGTIEFLVDDESHFYFMEMNTRLQVEHPVTEMITGLDLVAWQLSIAAGEPLPLRQSQLKKQGHAFEARIYAENPQNNFTPATGKLIYFSMPQENAHVRIDSGVRQGDEISPYYDPLMAKLIVWDKTRENALALLQKALSEVFIVGLDTNVSFLSHICHDPDFQQGRIHTNFIETHASLLQRTECPLSDELLALIALAKLHQEQLRTMQYQKKSTDTRSPWFIRDHWRLSAASAQPITYWYQDETQQLFIKKIGADYQLQTSTKTLLFQGNAEAQQLTVTINHHLYHAHVFYHDAQLHLFHAGQHYCLSWQNPKALAGIDSDENRFISPMPGTIVAIWVTAGQTVKKGDRLLTLEAMKMEHTIHAPADGLIESIHFQVGDLINEGMELLAFHHNQQ